MTSLEPARGVSTPPSPRRDDPYATRMSRVDGCPQCVSNCEPPTHVRDDDMHAGFLAYYTCTDCGHSWRTGWADERPGSAA